MPKIVIDPGHGGKDPGATGGGVQEKAVVLNVAKKIGAFLEARGCTVMLTREADVFVELSDRARMANAAQADLYVSVHCNSVRDNARATGMEVYHYTCASEASKHAARVIYDKLLPVCDLRGRGVKSKNLAVLRETSMPAVLVELGFISNDGDRAKLTNFAWQDDAAKTIADGIVEAICKP